MGTITVDSLEALIAKGRELQDILQSTPELATFAEALANAKEPVLLVDSDRLVLSGEAAKILGVNKSAISRYVRDGLLTPYYVPHSSSRRFRISDVWKIARRRSIESN